MPRIRKVLVANRGEIAVRIIGAAQSMGLRTVAVFSDADADALHVERADEAVRLGAAAASESYLAVAKIVEAARRTGADAVHPGYGFLAENPEFAEACHRASLNFIGPSPDAMRLMGDKAAAKKAATRAGVLCIPGFEGGEQDEDTLIRAAERVGFPLFVKAAAGGGGRGMRLVREAADLSSALRGARTEAQQAFGDGTLLLERALPRARHVEIQVFADTHGNVVHLGERECSVQRRHQKVIEEAPSPAVDGELRDRMGGAAVSLARSVNYVGAGTVEFLLDEDGAFFFLEMNTRLQVEHPVTELVTGVDLVAWQFMVAQGDALPLRQDQIHPRGHAIEVRLYSEDPRHGFVPQTGTIAAWRPPLRDGIRVDAGIDAGRDVSAHYDPMIAKVIAHGSQRETARLRLIAALEDFPVLGLGTNREFLLGLLQDERFVQGSFTTDIIDREGAARWLCDEISGWQWAAGIVLWFRCQSQGDGWTNAPPRRFGETLVSGEHARPLVVTSAPGGSFQVEVGEDRFEVLCSARGSHEYVLEIDGLRRRAFAVHHADRLHVSLAGREFVFERVSAVAHDASARSDGRVRAPTAGRVLEIRVQVGDVVERGAPIATLEAMKMEHAVAAPAAGRVEKINVRVGDQVANRQCLVEMVDS